MSAQTATPKIGTLVNLVVRAKMWDNSIAPIARAFAAEVGAEVIADRIAYPIKRQDFLLHHNGVDVRWDEPVTVTVSEQVPA